MSSLTPKKGVTLEVLGKCVTNITPDSTHDAPVEYRHLWSFAQEAALIAVSNKNSQDGCYRLIQDPEKRAMRIAAYYADLYFKSAEKSKGKIKFHWVALAAFVVKDIVEAFRFSREDVLHRDWKDLASIMRGSVLADIGSVGMTNDSPYQHALRTYAALAKGNLWLFMDIFPPLWFFLEYGLNSDGTLNEKRLNDCLDKRDWNTFQRGCKDAVEELPYGPNWLARLKKHLATDIVYRDGKAFFNATPVWTGLDGYGSHSAAASQAHKYCRENAFKIDLGYRTPAGPYWRNFKQAFFIMESEQIEMTRVANDQVAIANLVRLRNFKATDGVRNAYKKLVAEYHSSSKRDFQHAEVFAIAQHEQINILQPLVYDDKKLKETMDLNHFSSKLFGGWIAPKFKVIYSASSKMSDPNLETVFDPHSNLLDAARGKVASLPNQHDRMDFVRKIAKDFDRLMYNQTMYMEQELRKIRMWMSA